MRPPSTSVTVLSATTAEVTCAISSFLADFVPHARELLVGRRRRSGDGHVELPALVEEDLDLLEREDVLGGVVAVGPERSLLAQDRRLGEPVELSGRGRRG